MPRACAKNEIEGLGSCIDRDNVKKNFVVNSFDSCDIFPGRKPYYVLEWRGDGKRNGGWMKNHDFFLIHTATSFKSGTFCALASGDCERTRERERGRGRARWQREREQRQKKLERRFPAPPRKFLIKASREF